MTTTPNLLIDHIAASQAQKEVTANTAFDALDKALCQATSIALTDANLALKEGPSSRGKLRLQGGGRRGDPESPRTVFAALDRPKSFPALNREITS